MVTPRFTVPFISALPSMVSLKRCLSSEAGTLPVGIPQPVEPLPAKPPFALDQRNGQAQPPTPDADAKALNAYLDTLQAKVHEARHQLLMSGKPVTAEAVRNIVQGREASGERPHLLLEIFQYHNDQVKALVGKEYSKGTLTKFTTVLNHTRSFLQWKYKSDDIDIRKLDYEFITELEFWYKSIQHCDHNTTMKYIACVKKMVIRALRSGWLQHDPFMGFNLALREVEREALTAEELERMAAKLFVTDRLTQVRDIFLFSCYTGLAYSDVQKLRRSEISTGIDGGKWIFTRRQKTDTASRIPILPMAEAILLRYADHPQCRAKDRVLPILSNQKMNAYLKEIADLLRDYQAVDLPYCPAHLRHYDHPKQRCAHRNGFQDAGPPKSEDNPALRQDPR